MPTGLYTRWDYTEQTQKFNESKIEFGRLKTWACHTFKKQDLNANSRVATIHEHRKKLIAYGLMVSAAIVRLFVKQWVVISIFSLVKKLDLV